MTKRNLAKLKTIPDMEHWVKVHGRRLLLKSGGDIACPDHEAHFVPAWTQQVYPCKFLILYAR